MNLAKNYKYLFLLSLIFCSFELKNFNINVFENATTNRLLKQIGILANFNEEVILKKFRGANTSI